jgi:cell division protein FtsL
MTNRRIEDRRTNNRRTCDKTVYVQYNDMSDYIHSYDDDENYNKKTFKEKINNHLSNFEKACIEFAISSGIVVTILLIFFYLLKFISKQSGGN